MASAMVADFARMPTQRKVMVFAVIGVLAGLLYWRFMYRSLDDDLELAQADHTSKQQAVKKLEDDLPKYEELRTHMARLRELIEKNQTALPTAPELPAFFETLQHKVAESGVEIRKWTNRNEEPVESFIKVPVEIEIAGTFMQLKRFFASLVQGDIRPAGQASDDRANDERDRAERERGVRERIVSIENLALSSPTVRNREIILSAKFTAVTFRQEEKAVEKPAAGAPAARPAALPAPVAPPPPMPSAATPAGARARTESAIDKGAQRNRDATGSAEAPPAGSDRLKGGL